ncbi:alpha/beta fold hydrolase [Micromonospora yangpuensis]|uniref:Pimeloyl-ACP methyl ester carboxylesterase n=1 Tax=Micromonospora yangpuensis TaxID=683228 RepID=A0A1C6ULC3_9ACTN|nr:alpha/beta hydrolase [Micromonospora yangpuensis]GGM17603.1 hydrolase [Micromonospora yangpuensis]SCL54771.1 Pimeloyl-ACP methyl ester carboxylesterase [Micromonospora yangpuensis]
MQTVQKVRHRQVTVDGLAVFVREAGHPDQPTVLLLHGFPSSSHTFRQIMPALAEVAHVVAPDLPGFGMSSSPTVEDYDYTFANLARTIESVLGQLGVERFFVYLHDFGAPVGYHLATRAPARVRGLVVQNGNAHPAGLGPQWDSARAYWADPTDATRARLPDWLTFAGTRDQYLAGLPARLRALQAPESWHLDWARMSRPGNVEAQFALFTDYASHVARFDEIAAYHRRHQPPALLLWGRHDAYFDIAEVLAYHRALERLDAHLYDGGHLLLETHPTECAELIRAFVLDNT